MDIHYLADYPHHTEQIAQWNLDEWPSIYDGSLEKAVAYHAATVTRGGVPTCLVATENNILLGVVCILMDDLENRPDLNPWLGALYVNPEFRGRGIARKLVEACMNEARKAQLDILTHGPSTSPHCSSPLGGIILRQLMPLARQSMCLR